ncbi:MAG: polysaccharide pyruvyl transferase family protein [Pseudomonadota bacterium]
MRLLRQTIKMMWLFLTFPWRALCDVYFINFRKRYPVYFYGKVRNVGDRLNFFLVENISGRRVHNVRTALFPHLLPVGSILHFGNLNSVVWGSGLIREEDAFSVRFGSAVALRGALTRAALAQHHDLGEVVLGDPALLMPMFFKPSTPSKTYHIGIVPHLSERNLEIFKGIESESVTLIDVGLNEQEFISRLCECEYIVSSSLHGLILSDAYGIKNQWAIFSDLVIGGGFKFMDYYSTTINPNEVPRVILARQELEALLEEIEKISSVKGFSEDIERLLAVFPRRLND